jgi:RNA polymerase sigma factor (sigma-70 family)
MPAELFKEIKANNNSKAAVIIVAQYHHRLRAYLRKFTSDDGIIDDAVQGAYIVAFEKICVGSFPARALANCDFFFNYLKKIAFYKLMAIFKKRKRSRVKFQGNMSTEQESLSEESLSEELENQVKYCFEQLQETEKKILVLLHVKNRKHEEIALVLKISVSSSQQIASRARKKMKACLEKWLNQG